MNETDLMAFIQWLPTKVEAFQNKTPEEITQVLNNMAKTEEGKAELEKLIGEFKESNMETNMFKKGGRLDYLVGKLKKGGNAKKENKQTVKEGKRSDRFNRTAYRNMKSALRDQNLGLSRSEIKAIAMNNIIDIPESSIQNIENKLNNLGIAPIATSNLDKLESIASLDRIIAPKVKEQLSSDFSGSSFSKAFSEARKRGLSTFRWNGKLYGTELASNLSNSKLPKIESSLDNWRTRVQQEATSAAKGVRPLNMDEERIINDPSYSDYVYISNIWNPKKYDNRYMGPKNLNFKGDENPIYGSIPIEYRTNPRQLSSFLEKGGTLTNKFEKGGKQRKSDQFRKEFHGVDLFPYGPNSRRRSGYIYDAESIPSGIKTDVLPNGVGMRQVTNKNITTTELVSPDKRDTLYIHNGVAGRVDSNINDAGFLGYLGLKESTPVSDRYKELQKKFNSRFSKKK